MSLDSLLSPSRIALLVLSSLSCGTSLSAQQASAPPRPPTAAEISKTETVASALSRQFEDQEYEVRSAAEAMPADKYNFRAANGLFKGATAPFGPGDVRTFAELIKHIACANFAFADELDGKEPPPDCDKGGPSPAKTRPELLLYLRDSFGALKHSFSAISANNMFDPIEGPYAGPTTRLHLGVVAIWHAADHYGQMTVYLRLNGIVPPASRPAPPLLSDITH